VADVIEDIDGSLTYDFPPEVISISFTVPVSFIEFV